MDNALARFRNSVCTHCDHNPKCEGLELIECLLSKINSLRKGEV